MGRWWGGDAAGVLGEVGKGRGGGGDGLVWSVGQGLRLDVVKVRTRQGRGVWRWCGCHIRIAWWGMPSVAAEHVVELKDGPVRHRGASTG